MHIREATPTDATQIAEIWSHYIRDTIATFNPVEKTTIEIEQMLLDRAQADEPFLVATDKDKILGFATYGPFRGGEGYRFVKEHTIQLRTDATAKGIGRALMDRLETHGKAQNIQSLFAGISGENDLGVKFHRAIGFEHVCTIEKVGWKFDRWHDLILMRKQLQD